MTRVDDDCRPARPSWKGLAAAGPVTGCFLALLAVTAGGALGWAAAGSTGGNDEARSGSYRNEEDVKAAFVLNFIRLVNWTDVGTGASASELPICALANSDFASSIRRVAAGKSVGPRSLSLRFLSKPDPANCRVLILDEADYPNARAALDNLRDAPVLTIGNGPGLIPLGGMFELVVEDRKVQFDANLDAVRRSNLAVSARLLQLSRNLRKRPASGN